MATRCGYVAIVGKPNVGKSSLLNALVGHKVSIVSKKPGTTRHRVHAAVTRGHAQALFTDTPGLFLPKVELDRFMEKMVVRSVEGVDLVLFVSDDRGIEALDRRMLTTVKIRSGGAPAVLVLNKMDLVKRPEALVEAWKAEYGWKSVVTCSVKKKDGLDAVWEAIRESLPKKPFEVADDDAVAQDDKAFVSDLIREKALRQLEQEVPHAMAVVVREIEDKKTLRKVQAELIVERETQKAIVIGAGGKRIREIGTAARKELEEVWGTKVFLELQVKVKEKWRDDPSRLAEYGFSD